MSLYCKHRGAPKGKVNCQLCPVTGDYKRVTLFLCSIHGECTRLKTGEPIQDCKRCPDRDGEHKPRVTGDCEC